MENIAVVMIAMENIAVVMIAMENIAVVMIAMENIAVVMIAMENIAVVYFLDLGNFERRIVVGFDDTQVVVDKLDGVIMETEAIDNQANLVNYDNENEYEIEDLGYESEEYTEDAHEDDENNHSNGYAKRGITRLCKFRREYGKPGGVKLSVTFDALNRISGKHRALFSSFLGDMVREHIGLQILSWKKVGPEARNKLWDEITRYFDVDLTVRKLVMNRLGQLLRNFRRKLRQTYILPNQDTPSKLNEVPAKYTAILKAEDWVNFVNYTATEEYKVKSAKAKMARSKCVFPHTMGRGGYAHVKEKMIEKKRNYKSSGNTLGNSLTTTISSCFLIPIINLAFSSALSPNTLSTLPSGSGIPTTFSWQTISAL
ncbi:transposase, Ptta/En/Spm, transposase, Tnp1/En/Spm-like protein [Tanacetum coccineum]